MNKVLDQISALTAQLSPETRAAVEEKLVEETRKLVSAYQAELSARDEQTRIGLTDIEADRVVGLESFEDEMRALLNELDAAAHTE